MHRRVLAYDRLALAVLAHLGSRSISVLENIIDDAVHSTITDDGLFTNIFTNSFDSVSYLSLHICLGWERCEDIPLPENREHLDPDKPSHGKGCADFEGLLWNLLDEFRYHCQSNERLKILE